MTLTITGTIVDKEGKPIDKTHAEWMVRQFLTLLKWCGLVFHGSVADAKRADIYRTGVVDVPSLEIEKPVRMRHKYARQDASPALSIVPSDAHMATCLRCTSEGRTVKGGGVVKSEAETESAQVPNRDCPPGATCSVGGRILIVCAVCRRHIVRERVNTDTNICHTCQGVEGRLT